MTNSLTEFGQPIGHAISDWQGVARPPSNPIVGQYCQIEPLNAQRHIDDLYEAFSEDVDGILWTYMFVGPFESKENFATWINAACKTDDPLFHAIVDTSTNKAVGIASYLRIQPDVGVIEVGNITYSPRLQRTPMATEAMFLMMARAFDELGYRRYEWKCDALNAASCKAAKRLGFKYDGTFEQAIVYKGRNRDTAWFSILDRRWPQLKNAYIQWLDSSNFDARGMQKQRLQHFISLHRESEG